MESIKKSKAFFLKLAGRAVFKLGGKAKGKEGGHGGHWVLYKTDDSLTSTSETNNILYVNQLSLN